MSDITVVVKATKAEAEEFAAKFRKRFPYIYGDIIVPKPKRGGTFLYCTQLVERHVPKRDSLGRKTRYTATETGECGKKFRILKRYRRHYRRFHAEP